LYEWFTNIDHSDKSHEDNIRPRGCYADEQHQQRSMETAKELLTYIRGEMRRL